MSSFTAPLTVTKIGERKWRVEREFSYHIGSEGSLEVVTVPNGFETDFASVPRGLWNIIPPDGEYTQAAVLHDFLCVTKPFPQKRIDYIFYEAMVVLGVPLWKRKLMYWAVRFWHLF
jgi:hypothetical protein